jgi:hypothetical protein
MLEAVESSLPYQSYPQEVKWLGRDSCGWMDLLVVLARRYYRRFGKMMTAL